MFRTYFSQHSNDLVYVLPLLLLVFNIHHSIPESSQELMVANTVTLYCELLFYSFIWCFFFFARPGFAQGFFLVLCSGITPSRLGGLCKVLPGE